MSIRLAPKHQRLVLIVTHVDAIELPVDERPGGQARLELLRDRALIRTLFTSGMRREEVANLSRADVQDGYARQALITGKGSKERVVFFDEKAMLAIRTYLEARGDKLVPLFLRHDLGRGKQPGPGGHGRHQQPGRGGAGGRAGLPAGAHDGSLPLVGIRDCNAGDDGSTNRARQGSIADAAHVAVRVEGR